MGEQEQTIPADTPSIRRRRLGGTGPEVSVISIGTSPLGSNPGIYGYEVGKAQAIETVSTSFSSGINFLDTSNEYGGGESELRIGAAIRNAGGPPKDFVIATKADPVPGETTFSGDRVRRSFDESVARLGVEYFELFHLHDPERYAFSDIVAPGGAVEAMVELKRQGLVGRIGVAGGDIAEMHRYVDLGVFDVLLNHTQYTLLDQSADALIDSTIAAGMSFINAGPYASGMLAKPAKAAPNYQYRAPSHEIRGRTEAIRAFCDSSGVPLPALALQFSSRDPRILSTVVGVSTPDRVDELVRNETRKIPVFVWEELSELLGFLPRAAPSQR